MRKYVTYKRRDSHMVGETTVHSEDFSDIPVPVQCRALLITM